tara:strand:- start:32 stop:391 length:360 start_codon:yes stop_codon:yes gene_type:complete
MPKQQINYEYLSSKELELLKEIYIDRKVSSMNLNDLKEFATESISLQVRNTIGNDEEMEVWQEMEEFFKNEFESVLEDIKSKMKSKKEENKKFVKEINESIQLKVKDKDDAKKEDMWED